MAGKGRPRTGGGSRKGCPNKATADLKKLILGALSKAGGERYLVEQATANPSAFLSLIGKVLPSTIQGSGPGGEHLQRLDVTVTYRDSDGRSGAED